MSASKKLTTQRLNQLASEAFMQPSSNPAREVVFSLLRHISALDWEIDSLIKSGKHEMEANDRLTDNILQLQREKRRLQDEVNAVKIGRKVTVPREVAKALEYFQNNSTGKQTILRSLLNDRFTGTNISSLRGFSTDNFDRLLSAMVNGYTVEQTQEDRIGMKISSLLFAMNIESPVPVDQLARQLASVLRDELAESSKFTN